MSKKSILQDKKECFYCGVTLNLERHHVIFGTARRRIADKLGLTVWLCPEHHRGQFSPHNNREFDLRLKRFAQSCYEENHTRDEWREKVGRSYL